MGFRFTQQCTSQYNEISKLTVAHLLRSMDAGGDLHFLQGSVLCAVEYSFGRNLRAFHHLGRAWLVRDSDYAALPATLSLEIMLIPFVCWSCIHAIRRHGGALRY